MTKKKTIQTALAIVFGMGIMVASDMDPNTRMEKVRELFTVYGADTFKVLNGQGIGGSGSSESGKAMQTVGRADIATVINSTDGNSFVFCVVDSKWAVYPPDPSKIGQDATTATDTNGMQFLQTLIAALKSAPDGKASAIPYSVQTPGGSEKRLATVWHSKNLLKRKNDTGQKFFCGTSIKASS